MIVAQIFLPIGAPLADSAGLAARRTRPVVAPVAPDYPDILAAPIFAPDRRPGPTSQSIGSGPLAGYAAVGAAVGRDLASAVVAAPSGQVRVLHRGDEVNGWRLTAIDRARLVFERQGAIQTLAVGAPAEAASTSGADQ
jgi:hypothetical protein